MANVPNSTPGAFITNMMANHPNSTSEALLATLTILNHRDLPTDCRVCHICQEPFSTHTEFTDENLDKEDIPVKLPCNHILGSACLTTWINTHTTNNNSCPLCRAVIFPQSPNIQTYMDADLAALNTLMVESSANTARLIELQRGPQSEATRAEIARVREALAGVEARLGEMEVRVRAVRNEMLMEELRE